MLYSPIQHDAEKWAPVFLRAYQNSLPADLLQKCGALGQFDKRATDPY
jgi:hypothetical protein